MLFDTRPSWKLEERPGTSSSPGSSAAFVPWKKGPGTRSQFPYVTGRWVPASSLTARSLLRHDGRSAISVYRLDGDDRASTEALWLLTLARQRQDMRRREPKP